MTIGEWINHAKASLEASGCPDPAIDARWIAEDVLHMTAPELRFEAQNMLSAEDLEEMNECLERRVQGEPVQYILKRADFMGMQLYVDSRVLIPRQDTETLAEAAIIELQRCDAPAVLDLCTGSGALGLSIKSLCPSARVTVSDISTGALEVTRRNAHSLNVDLTVRHGDLFDAVLNEKFDLIVSNPPYIRKSDMHLLQRELQFEPTLALEAGVDGLDFYRRIAMDAPAHLKKGGSIYFEVGYDQAHQVLALLNAAAPWRESGVICDLNGIERIVWARS